MVLLHGLMGEMDHWESTLEALGAAVPRAGARGADPRSGAGRGVDRGAGRPRRRLPGRARDPAGRGRRQLARRPPGAGAGAPVPGPGERADPDRLVRTLRAQLHARRAPRADHGVRAREDGGDLLRRRRWSRPSWVESVRRIAHDARAPRCACSTWRARPSAPISRPDWPRSRCRRSWCGARTIASRRPRSPSGSGRCSATPSSSSSPTAATRRCSSSRRSSTRSSRTGCARRARSARSRPSEAPR